MRTVNPAFSLGCAGLGEGTNANTFRTTNIVHYTIAGRSYVKAATDNLAFSAVGTALAAKQMCAFFVLIDAAGTVTTQQSTIVPSPDAQSYMAGCWEWPQVKDKAVLGAIVIRTNNSATFTANTTDFGATDVIDTFHNVADVLNTPVTY